MSWIEMLLKEPTARVCPVDLSTKAGMLLRWRSEVWVGRLSWAPKERVLKLSRLLSWGWRV